MTRGSRQAAPPTPPPPKQYGDAMSGFLDRASAAGRGGAGTTAVKNPRYMPDSQKFIPPPAPVVETPAPRPTRADRLGGESLGGVPGQGTSEPALNRSRASRSRRIK